MFITTTPNLHVLPPSRAAAISAHAMEAGHFVSVTHDLRGEFKAAAPVKGGVRNAILTALELPDDKGTRALEKSVKDLGKDLAKQSPISHSALEGVELFFSTRAAAAAFRDPDSASIAKLGAAGKAMAEMLDLAKVVFPNLKQSTGVEVFGVILKLGNMAYQVHVDVEAEIAESKKNPFLRPAF